MYVTVEEYEAYAESVGVTIPVDDDDKTIQLEKASRYIDGVEDQLIGIRVLRDQTYAYPRNDLVINGFSYSNIEIPDIVKKCQMELALEINAGIDIYERGHVLPVVAETVVGAVSVQYANPSGAQARQRRSLGLLLLQKLMKSQTGSIRLVRT